MFLVKHFQKPSKEEREKIIKEAKENKNKICKKTNFQKKSFSTKLYRLLEFGEFSFYFCFAFKRPNI
jgi:hypothetical protein